MLVKHGSAPYEPYKGDPFEFSDFFCWAHGLRKCTGRIGGPKLITTRSDGTVVVSWQVSKSVLTRNHRVGPWTPMERYTYATCI
jgi:hypothetical protein